MAEPIMSSCPPLAALLRVSDGEASSAEWRMVSTHLWCCSSCRDRLSTLESIAEECAALVVGAIPTSASSDRFVAGLHQHLRARPVRVGASPRWLTAAAAVPLIVLGLLLSRSHTALVQAEALLVRALVVEGSMPSASTPAIARWRPHTAATLVSTMTVHEADPTVIAELRQYGVDLSQPPSVKAFRAWRARLSRHRDIVREIDGLLVLRTTTTDGRIRMAELAVRPDTYVLVRETFVFDGLGRLDLAPGGHDENRAHAPASTPPAPLAVAESPAIERDALDYAELRARLALRAVDLDLTETVRVVSSVPDGVVRIEGTSSSTARRAMSNALADVRRVDVALRVDEHAPIETMAPAVTIGLTRWLDRTYGPENSDAKQRFLPELRRNARLVARRLQALEALGRRYPTSIVRGMASSRRALLQTLVEQHHAALADALNAYGAQIAVLSGATPTLAVAMTTAPRDWRVRVRRASTPATDLERLLVLEPLFENEENLARGWGSPDVTPIRSAFEQLWDALNRP